VIGLLVLGVILIAGVWFTFHYIFWVIQPVAVDLATDLNANGTQYTQVDTFFQAIDNWIAIIALLVLVVFGFVYSQRRGVEV